MSTLGRVNSNDPFNSFVPQLNDSSTLPRTANLNTRRTLLIENFIQYPSGVLGEISRFFDRHPNVVIGLQALTVTLIIGGLITASVFSFGAAIPLIAALTASSSTGSVMGAFALLGTGVGLAASAVWTGAAAAWTEMHKAHEGEHLPKMVDFLLSSLIGSVVTTGLFALSGADLGLKGAIAAEAGLSTLGTAVFFGSGAAIVRSFLK